MFSIDYELLIDMALTFIDTIEEGQEVEISLGYESRGTMPVIFVGEVTAIEPIFGKEKAILTISGYDFSHRLTRGNSTRSFDSPESPELQALDVMEDVASKTGFSFGTGDVESSSNSPKYWNLPQLATNDYEFIQSLGHRLGYHQQEADHWQNIVNVTNYQNWFDSLWQKNGVKDYFGAGDPNKLSWTTFAYLNLKDFPEDLARDMVETWALDDVTGFNRQGQIGTNDLVSWQELIDNGGNTNFMITPDTNFFALKGIYRSGVYDHANRLTLAHLKNYHMKWGIPCAPEAVRADYGFHGDQYSNFNGGDPASG